MKHEAVNTSMTVDYFTVDGLTKKTGLSSVYWDMVIFKELIDNALDAIEPLPEKHISIQYDSTAKIFGVYDNGSGIKADAIEKSIYNFSVYHSSKRHLVTPSRGKQGNGLKTVICICHLTGHDLLWHTSEGDLLRFLIDDTRKEYGEIAVRRQRAGKTESKGVTVRGVSPRYLTGIVSDYARCNPDVNITFLYDGEEHRYNAKTTPVDRSGNTNIAFYNLGQFKSFLSRQDDSKTYKRILQETFGTVIANKSTIKGKLNSIDLDNPEFTIDFEAIRGSQAKKKYTALKPHMIGLDNHFFTEDKRTGIPYCIEFSLKRLPKRYDELSCLCYVNNSITYKDAWGMTLDHASGIYKVGSRKEVYASSLEDILGEYHDYYFIMHFISPQLSYMDTGKVSFDVSGIIEKLCEELTRALNREQRHHRLGTVKPPSKRELMRAYLPEAFELASSGGKHSITVRQLYYKVRELSGIDETDSTYPDFTQNIITEWLEQNPEADEKVYFNDRGNFYIEGKQEGLGTGNVREAINADGTARNKFLTFGGLTESLYLQSDFGIRYKYDKALYIEKTGFDNIFRDEHIEEKYRVLLVSGQGFGTRACKELLYYYQQQGLKLYCLHDLDYSGVSIINALREPNEKFPEPLHIEDLGITLEDVQQYNIAPEQVKAKDKKEIDQSRYTLEQQRFFFKLFKLGYVQRVELNAFTTEQILEIIDRKLSKVDTLPRLRLSQAVSIDPDKLKKAVLMRILKKRFSYLVDQMPEPDVTGHDEDMTVYEVQERAEGILDSIMQDMERGATEKLNKIIDAT